MVEIMRLNALQSNISALEVKYARDPNSVRLIAVSKTRSVDEVMSLVRDGQSDFGENYLQEALLKVEALADKAIQWHFIGAIQSRKAQQIALNFDWVHTVDRLKVANILNKYSDLSKPLNVLIQVNLEDEASKGGVRPDALKVLAKQIEGLPNLRLRGLMFMPKLHHELETQRAVFHQAKSLFDELQQIYPSLDQLSMGMSGDMEAAIAEGATMIRIGTALFGTRD